MENLWIAILAFLGAGGGGKLIYDAIKALVTGRAKAEKEAYKEAMQRGTSATARADCEAENRRRLQEQVAALERLLISHGVPADTWPPDAVLALCSEPAT